MEWNEMSYNRNEEYIYVNGMWMKDVSFEEIYDMEICANQYTVEDAMMDVICGID